MGAVKPSSQGSAGASARGRVTLRRISELSGVSQPVVSAVLGKTQNSTVRYSDATRQRVEAIAAELNYRPNRGARNMLSSRHNMIGVLLRQAGMIPRMGETWLLRRAASHGQMIAYDYMGPGQTEPPLFLREDCIDGLLVFEDFGDAFRERIHEIGLPAVWVNNNYRTGGDCITFDESGAMEMVADRFHARGIRGVLLVHERNGHYSAAARANGLAAAIRARALTSLGQLEPVALREETPFSDWRRELADRLSTAHRKGNAPIGILVHLAEHGLIVYDVARDLGLQIPQDVAVVAIDEKPLGLCCRPPLSSIRLDVHALADHAVDRLQQRIEGEKPDRPLRLAYELRERGSLSLA